METTFEVTFTPSTTGLHTVTVRVVSDDVDESPYDFAIAGTGFTLAPELTFSGNGLVIGNGDDTPSLQDHTKFENTKVGAGRSSRLFTIKNTGNAGLVISEALITGGEAAEFSLGALPTGPVAPGGSVPLQVFFDPGEYGLRRTTLRLRGNDPNTPLYEIALAGGGGVFELQRIERSGDDAILFFSTNPDTEVTTYIYNILSSPDLENWTSLHSFSSPGGTLEQFRHLGGFRDESRYWRITEVRLP